MKAQMAKTMEIPQEERRLEKQLCFAVYATAHAFTRAYKPILDKVGLTYPQYLVMLVLWEKAELPVKTIGEQLDLDSGTLSPLLKRLEQTGLIKRTRDARDERQVIVSLTPKGRSMKSEAATIMTAIGQAAGCTLEEMAEIRGSLQKLRGNLNAAV
ncbi:MULTISPECIES: MarR family winged helix-turn-helix transcriptional regulator [Rhizobium]|jgi:MarR family transcriptional regulator, organic hydroperoxide resistance regulator|uniref:MarR family transcriptional regulator protein n=3 Tax=Rhizobium TaxID=379 RepID=A0A0B4X159_9HYPH|nr:MULTISPECIES: MarR family transcriptional regulator [Rhizobium]OWK24304.1 MarR family transcriptional regulator [Rhizobium yanglingense]TDW20001.1 MarR family transcriptional regulator [Rhizobium azibense]AJD40450.1 MarR family transcriptional regulator protein [Rhizobium gallicum bv. gallicum R602sp]MBB4228052.1 DNA-binding MarR family transcriptional regulator [Rhizobium mongolense]MBB4274413.1 DNA-binding MarR family transcriptional regulator [Rhizobium mongolense]